MTRADAMSEPSMEDILASIRRIIAEDPPGSRPAPAASVPAPTPSSPLRPMQLRDPAPFDKLDFDKPAFDAPSQDLPTLKAPGFDQPAFDAPRNTRAEPATYEPQLPRFSSPDPFLKADPAFGSAFPAPSQPPARQPSRSEFVESPRFDAAAAPTPEHVAFEPPAAPAAPSIDDQLSGLLDDVAPARTHVTPASAEAPMPIAPMPMTPMQMTPAATEPKPTARSEPDFSALGRLMNPAPARRPGFTVSRIGFTGEAVETAQSTTQSSAPSPAQAPAEAQDTPKAPAAFDPFEFDLGPSPFARGTPSAAAPAAAEASASAARSTFASDIDALIAEVSSKTAASVASDAAAPAEVPVAPETPAAAPEAVADAPQADDASVVPAATDAEPVAATIAAETVEEHEQPVPEWARDLTQDLPAEAAPAGGDRAPNVDTMSAVAEAPAKSGDRARDILPLAPSPASVSFETAFAPMTGAIAPSIRSLAQTEYLSASPASSLPAAYETPVSHMPATQRTAEDALAELLRPMLRTWLAENMPRIVERALRQELASLTDQKTAAE